MQSRTLICFPTEDAPGLRTEAAQLAFGLAACGHDVHAIGVLGAWRHPLRLAKIAATECDVTRDPRRLSSLVEEYEPRVIHAFGVISAQQVLPLTMLVGAVGVATLGHVEVASIPIAVLRSASTVFVPCDAMREPLARRLPGVSVITSGHLLPSPNTADVAARNRFLADELGLDEHAPMILLADRFQGGETEVALTLLEAAPVIAERVPGVQIMLAGAGARLGEVEALAADVNTHVGRRVVLLPGHRDDVEQLLSLATVAVGSGRFAMESLGAGVALVAAGAAGMIGTYTGETASVCRFTCCGRHGRLEPITPKAIASEIIGLFAYPQYREQFATAGQAAVLAEATREHRAEQIATYYGASAPTGTVTRSPQRITIVLPDALRDLLFTLPAISGIRARYPLTTLRLLTHPLHRSLLEQSGLAEQVLLKPARMADWWRCLRTQWRPRADHFLSFDSDLSIALMAVLSLAPNRVGFVEGSGTLFYSDHLSTRIPSSPERALMLANAIGVSTAAPIPSPTLLPETQDMVNQSLLPAGVEYGDPMILLCPQPGDPNSWPMEHWTALAAMLGTGRPERVAVLGAADVVWPEGTIKVMPVQDSLILATLLARASVVIAPESAPLHLADVLGVPTVGLYGPNAPDAFSLPNPLSHPLCHNEYPCHPCGVSPCTERHCLQAILPAEVARAVDEALSPVLA